MATTTNLNAGDPIAGHVDESLPVIDGEELLRRGWQHALPIAQRARDHLGFLCIDLSRRSLGIVESVLQSMQQFFPLDEEYKATNAADAAGHGWTAPFLEPAYQPGTIANVESFDVLRSSIEARNGVTWPRIAGFRQSVVDCWHEYLAIGDAVLELLAHVVGVDPNCFVANCGSRELNTLRLLHYPSANGPLTEQDVGIAAHTDFECITLLYQSAPGLELRRVDGNWLDATVAPGRMIVLFGDMLETWTNGRLAATGHRVRRTLDERFSVVMFLAVDDHVTVAPLPPFFCEAEPPRYSPISQAAHIDREIDQAKKNADAVRNARVDSGQVVNTDTGHSRRSRRSSRSRTCLGTRGTCSLFNARNSV